MGSGIKLAAVAVEVAVDLLLLILILILLLVLGGRGGENHYNNYQAAVGWPFFVGRLMCG